jgi:uncharacterized protein (DUF169 family)
LEDQENYDSFEFSRIWNRIWKMMKITRLYSRLIESMGVEGLEIPVAYVKFYRNEEPVPDAVTAYHTGNDPIMCCQAVRHSSLGEPVLLTLKNIGCVAAAISLGLVDQNRATPLSPPRTYTDLMQAQSGMDNLFNPPSPREFTSGAVYACQSIGRSDYGLFGPEDSGRFKDTATAQKAISGMMAIQPPVMQGVFFFNNSFRELDLEPDVILMSVRPVELTKIIEGYQYHTGKMVTAVMGAVRAVDSDLIARPYLTGEINVSPYCLGARVVARFEANRLGLGIPFTNFELLVKGMEESKTGYPFDKYAGAGDFS